MLGLLIANFMSAIATGAGIEFGVAALVLAVALIAAGVVARLMRDVVAWSASTIGSKLLQ